MADALEEAFIEEARIAPLDARALAGFARARISSVAESDEEPSEDLVLRLRDPKIFGTFAVSVLSEERVPRGTKALLAEHAFDLLPLPRGEADVILVEARAPPRLLDLAAFLAAEDRFTVLHVMHLLFAVFLDRALVTNVDRRTRTAVLEAVVLHAETPERVRALYACLHLAAVPEVEAYGALRRILRGGASTSLKRALASIVASPDGGVRALADLAREEGLIAGGEESTALVSNIPRLPERLGAVGRRWLRG